MQNQLKNFRFLLSADFFVFWFLEIIQKKNSHQQIRQSNPKEDFQTCAESLEFIQKNQFLSAPFCMTASWDSSIGGRRAPE